MNKKKLTTICVSLAVVLVVLVGVAFLLPGNTQDNADGPKISPIVDTPQAEDNALATDEVTGDDMPVAPNPSAGDDSQETTGNEPAPVPGNTQEEPVAPGVTATRGVVESDEDADLDFAEDDPAPGSTNPPPSTDTSAPADEGNVDVPDITTVTYEDYIAMTGAQQQAFINQFASTEEFVKWYNASKAKYDAEHPDIEIGGDTVIDGSQLGGN